MPSGLLAHYLAAPLDLDEEVRRQLGLPEDRYYTVSVWPEHLAGRVFVDKTRTRVVRNQKISKSAQYENTNT